MRRREENAAAVLVGYLTIATGFSVVLCQNTVSNVLHVCHLDSISTFSIKEILSRKYMISHRLWQEDFFGCIVPEFAHGDKEYVPTPPYACFTF